MFGNVWLVTRININNLRQCLCGDIEIQKDITSEQRLNADIWKIIVWSPWPNIEWVYDHLNRDQNPTPRSPGAPEDAKTKFVAIDVRVFLFQNKIQVLKCEAIVFPSKQSFKVWNIGCFIETQNAKLEIVVVSSKPKVQRWTSFSLKTQMSKLDDLLYLQKTKLEICVPSPHQRITIGIMCALTKTKILVWEWFPQNRHFKMGHMRLCIKTKISKLQLSVFHQNPKFQVGSTCFP